MSGSLQLSFARPGSGFIERGELDLNILVTDLASEDEADEDEADEGEADEGESTRR